tara:strand:+ start:752 stop:1123 length:372 start_codon:yes stop_codon:yes gene_type:complete
MKINKYFLILILFFLSQFTFVYGANKAELVDEISKNLRCLICQGQSIYDSNSDFAESMKILILRKISEGKNKKEIYEFLKSKYGDWIVYEPTFNKHTYFLWLLPLILFIFGGILILKKTLKVK